MERKTSLEGKSLYDPEDLVQLWDQLDQGEEAVYYKGDISTGRHTRLKVSSLAKAARLLYEYGMATLTQNKLAPNHYLYNFVRTKPKGTQLPEKLCNEIDKLQRESSQNKEF